MTKYVNEDVIEEGLRGFMAVQLLGLVFSILRRLKYDG